ncbi:unnamed protein product [Rotaria magnacalcarata]|nr:unnamed protein product [Rotaria magnacalcarata]CAF3802760.1 unnamed protein product [Rotaria magnacalcarata]CAF3814830.1 unnamed protein product [Rotaria magnacalcarata]
MATSSDAVSLQRIFKDNGISQHFEENYPHVSELLRENFQGTAATLCMAGSSSGQTPLQLFKVGQNMRCAQHGTDNAKTWTNYRQAVLNYLKSLNDDRRLEHARTALADHIYNMHYKRYPNWPNVGELQQSEVYLNVSSSYPLGSWFIGWSCVGYVTVRDYRANSSSYYTDFQGRPDFKIVYCNKQRLQEFEALAQSDMARARQHILDNQLTLVFRELMAALTQ